MKVATMNRFVLTAATIICFGSSAIAAGVDSRAYTCPALQSLIAASRFVFINNPDFEDFVVAADAGCSGTDVVQVRSVPTIDTPQCIVNYCRARGGSGGGGGG